MFYFTFDILLLLIVFVLALARPWSPLRRLRRLRRDFRRLANRRWTAIVAIGLFVLAIDVGFGAFGNLPAPAEDDEFSYLLAADTFAHGRLTNPPHPLWEHFETHNVIHLPSYQSKFPPGQGFVLALGQLLTGWPIVGVWLITALACAAVCWMFYGWLPPPWALTGGVLVAAHIGIVRFWGHDYMGGSLAMLGGALLYGALPRLLASRQVHHAMVMAAGITLLANSRPYEGAITCLPVAVLLCVWFFRQSRRVRLQALLRVVLPAGTVLAIAGCWMAYYNYRVTGNPWRMPYQVWVNTYSPERTQPAPLFFFAASSHPDAENAPPRVIGPRPGMEQWELWNRRRADIGVKLLHQWSFYLRVLLTPPLLALPFVLRNRRMRFVAGTVMLVLTAIVLENTHGFAHYAAPIAALILLLVIQGVRHLRLWCPMGRPVGRAFAPLLLAAYVLTFEIWLVQWAEEPVLEPDLWGVARAKVERQLSDDGEPDLVLIRYPKTKQGTITWNEWVHNGADIDSQPVVWARDLGETRNRELLEYYRARRVWVLDLEHQRLTALTAPKTILARKTP